jgi:predicted nucleic acid-binding protein
LIAYLDSSVVLRVVLGQADQLAEWRKIETPLASGLMEVECLRTIDRLRVAQHLSVEDAVRRRETVFRALEAFELLDITPAVLRRAAQPMSVMVGTLDAIHLATAELWREAHPDEMVFATHDRSLALAARATGFRVVGV